MLRKELRDGLPLQGLLNCHLRHEVHSSFLSPVVGTLDASHHVDEGDATSQTQKLAEISHHGPLVSQPSGCPRHCATLFRQVRG